MGSGCDDVVGTGEEKVRDIEGKEESKVTQQKQAFAGESESIHASKTMTGKGGSGQREGQEGRWHSKQRTPQVGRKMNSSSAARSE